MAPKAYGPVEYAAPSINASGADYTSVDDSTQANYPLGGTYTFFDSSGYPRRIKYVQYSPSATGTWAQGGFCFYTNLGRSIVSTVVADALTYKSGSYSSACFSLAGVLLNASEPSAKGDFTWIQVEGYNAKILLPNGTAVGDILVASNAANANPTADTWVGIHTGTDVGCIANTVNGFVIALAANSSGAAALGAGWIRSLCSF